MLIRGDRQAIIVPEELARDLREIGDHWNDLHEQEIDQPRVAVLRMFVDSYVDEFRDDFVFDEDERPIHVGRHRD